jgi:ribosomal protein S18 acetylase RimI-like enzyme
MKLSDREKDRDMLTRLLAISDQSFSGVERPPYEVFRDHFNDSDVFVDCSIRPAAFAIVTDRGGPYIWSIAVQPSLRKQGIGAALLREVIAYYRNQEQMHIALTCKVDNVPAQILYLKTGFRPVRVMKEYYAKEGDGVTMRMPLYPNIS